MTSPLKLIATSKATRTRNKAIFREYIEVASVRHHPALAAVPHPARLRRTREFLKSPGSRKSAWNKTDMCLAVTELAYCLDIDWPEWSMTRTNVFGLILSDLFRDFVPWLEQLPTHARLKSSLVGVLFEKYLFAAAHERHYTKYYYKKSRARPDWFGLAYADDKARMDVGHPAVTVDRKKRVVSWRAYQEAALAQVSWYKHVVPEDEYVYV
ncbi:hypothetical protein RhiJN_05963 [Ceratobasidium sp. AG-Ba]|nr:hypothetical protein RhiJN_05963 [Ceratobasidium sp. AG-Ba]QRW06888.1 hypothetical protein RhiLY_05887 [Ceratobasidium sp. AG-Ba]